jgi:hypothetical protein
LETDSAPSAGDERPAEKNVVLVVEDEVLVRLSVAEYLRDCGYHVLEAANASEAVEVLRTSIPRHARDPALLHHAMGHDREWGYDYVELGRGREIVARFYFLKANEASDFGRDGRRDRHVRTRRTTPMRPQTPARSDGLPPRRLSTSCPADRRARRSQPTQQ